MVKPESWEIKQNKHTMVKHKTIPSSDTELNTWNIIWAWSPRLHGLVSPSEVSCFHVTSDAARVEHENKLARGVTRRCKPVKGRTCYTHVRAFARKRELHQEISCSAMGPASCHTNSHMRCNFTHAVGLIVVILCKNKIAFDPQRKKLNLLATLVLRYASANKMESTEG